MSKPPNRTELTPSFMMRLEKLRMLNAFRLRVDVKGRQRFWADKCAAVFVGVNHRPYIFQSGERVASRRAEVFARDFVSHVFEKRVNAAREGCAKILDARVQNFGRRILAEAEGLAGLGRGPVGEF